MKEKEAEMREKTALAMAPDRLADANGGYMP